MESFSIHPYDDYAFLVQWNIGIDKSTNQIIHAAAKMLSLLPETEEVVPAYNSLLWIGKYYISNKKHIKDIIKNTIEVAISSGIKTNEVVKFTIPVCYEEEFALDMEEVVAYTDLNRDEIIEIHTSSIYHVFMMGFLPGFPFLGGLDGRLQMPRKMSPRNKVTRGSVGIGESQTGMYPMDSPGGWNIIGRCPLPLYLPGESPPMLIKANCELQFQKITVDEFINLSDRFQFLIRHPQKLKKLVIGEFSF